ncbi:hypothetical protein IB277_37110, partial [Ensifer sp. ENS07]|uniref:calcium-binding protein n=1 Tax=Ensifer sp. ENS07 TaxID=2769274 RepID=UPI0019876A71
MAIINGTAGNDNLFGVANERNNISGLAGDDYLQGGDLRDLLFGGDGTDNLYGAAGNDFLAGGVGNDYLFGGDGADELHGEAGDDFLYGEEGDDYLYSESGNDTLNGGTGDDYFYLQGVIGETKTVFGEEGDDRIYAAASSDSLDGGRGQDWVSYINSDAAVNINLLTGIGSGGYAAGDTYRSIEDVQGSLYNDKLTANGNYNEVFGYDGDDLIEGGAG